MGKTTGGFPGPGEVPKELPFFLTFLEQLWKTAHVHDPPGIYLLK